FRPSSVRVNPIDIVCSGYSGWIATLNISFAARLAVEGCASSLETIVHSSGIILLLRIPSSSPKGGKDITDSGEKVWVILCLAIFCNGCTISIANDLSFPEFSAFLLPLSGLSHCFA
nr:hypothetical protein [Tanacetum cinerariifolium]